LKNTILEKANLIGVNLRGVSLEGAKLDKAIYDQRTINTVELKYQSLFKPAYKIEPKSDLSKADLSDQVLDGLDLRDAILEKAELPRAHLIGTQLQDAILKDADLTAAILKDADLTGADFTGAKLKEVIGLTVTQLKTVKSLKDAQFSSELCQAVREELKETKGKIADCPQ
jgi:uncharacterized protein YjbI with pentapeptide repeats